ncbi:hypothetical protein OH77DRAFT_121615 [Trametes cingulata]|nr:hypothetical protein OH77DRAFT_121615 [Trametes cingulata]
MPSRITPGLDRDWPSRVAQISPKCTRPSGARPVSARRDGNETSPPLTYSGRFATGQNSTLQARE